MSAARVIVIGGGAAGCSIAYHLAQGGWREVVLLERGELTGGTTFHSAGLVGQLRTTAALTQINMLSVQLYDELQQRAAGGGRDPGWKKVGSLRLASSPERLREIERQVARARRFGLELHLIDARQARELFPVLDAAGVCGALWMPGDGHIDPSALAYALADGARLLRGRRFCAHGIAGAGGVGRVMAEWIMEGRPPLDLARMDVRRFDAAPLDRERARARALHVYATYYDIRDPSLWDAREATTGGGTG